MEIRPALKRMEGGHWICSCDMVEGHGDTPEEAYMSWLAGFQYRGPHLPINFFDGEVHSRETDRRT